MADLELRDLVISKDRIIQHKECILGRGGYGYVCLGTLEKEDGELEKVAVKMMITEGSIPEHEKKRLVKEACKLREVSQHDNIVKLLGVLMEADNYGLVLELMVFVDCRSFVNDYEVCWPQNSLPIQLCHQVTSAMKFLHAFNPPVLHLDLKADNILINHEFDAKICDFGISEWKTKTTRPADSRLGTLTHLAPEILLDVNIKSTQAQDVYSYGICVWEMFTGQRPYEGKANELIKASVKDGQRPNMSFIGERCPDYMVTMMKQCWNQDPEFRPSFEALQNQLGLECKKLKKEIFQGKKAVRRKICTKHTEVNDIKRLKTDYWDDLIEPLNDADISFDAEPGTPESTKETPEEMQVEVTEKMPASKNNVVLGKQYKFNLSKKDTPFDIKVREILRDPLLMEMVLSGNGDYLFMPDNIIELLSDPVLLQKYIDEDTDLKFELQRYGHSVFDIFHSPKIKDAKHKGSISQREAKDNDVFHYTKYHPTKKENEKTEREKRQDTRQLSMRNCSYIGKLYKSGLYQKVMKALKEPHQIREALNDQETGSGEVEKFSIIGSDVLNVLKDPIMMQVLLSQDPQALDTLMRYYPEVTMKLLACNKTQYGRGGGGKGKTYKRSSSEKDMPQSRLEQDPFDDDPDIEIQESSAHVGHDPLSLFPGLLPSGQRDQRIRDMIFGDPRRRRLDDEFRRQQMPLKKEKKREPVTRKDPTSLASLTAPVAVKITEGSLRPGSFNNRSASAKMKYEKPSLAKPRILYKKELSDLKTGDAEKLKKSDPLSLEASMDEMSLEETADGIILYSEADRNTIDDKMGVTEALTLLKNSSKSIVPNLQLRLLDELPVGGLSEFHMIEYILSHFNYIFVFVTPNLTPDTLKRFQTQMCLLDTVLNNSWRVIPIVRDKELQTMPLELQILHSLQLWNLKSAEAGVRNMFITSFTRTILTGRQQAYATKFPSPGVSKGSVLPSDKNKKVPSEKQPTVRPTKNSTVAPSSQQQRQAGSKAQEPSSSTNSDDTTESRSDEEPDLKKGSIDDVKYHTEDAMPGLHELTHKHSGGGLTKIRFHPGAKLPNLQVGNKNIMVIGAGGDDTSTPRSKPKKPEEKVKLTESEEPISKDDIDSICSEIGKDWRRLSRKLGFSDGESEQFYLDYHTNGVYEIMYQVIRRWTQKCPKEVTKKNVAEMLHALERDDLSVLL